MNQIERMDKAACRRIADETEQVLTQLAYDLGLTVKIGGGSYDPTTGTFKPKVEFALPDADRRGFERSAALVGLKPEDYGREFTSRGNRFTVTGINLRAQRFPILARRSDGKTFKFAQAAVVSALGTDA